VTRRYPIDALLRPPVELVSTVVAGTAAWLAWIAPWAWMTTAPVARGAAVGLGCLALPFEVALDRPRATAA